MNSQYPLITIAIPVYGVADYIEKSLLSALNQSYSNIEILIIDDKGPDDSIQKAGQIISMHPRGNCVKIIDHIVNQGTGATKNTAVKVSKGKYLYFLDGDDYIIDENTIQILYECMCKTKVNIVLASFADTKGTEILSEHSYPNIIVKGDHAISLWMEETNMSFQTQTWNKLYDIEFLRNNDITCYPDHRSEDGWFTFEVVCKAKSVASLSAITYAYELREGSAMHQNITEYHYRQYLEIMDSRSNLLSSLSNYPRTLNDFYLEPLHLFLPDILFSNLSKKKKKDFVRRLHLMLVHFPLSRIKWRGNLYVYLLLRIGSYFLIIAFLKLVTKGRE